MGKANDSMVCMFKPRKKKRPTGSGSQSFVSLLSEGEKAEDKKTLTSASGVLREADEGKEAVSKNETDNRGKNEKNVEPLPNGGKVNIKIVVEEDGVVVDRSRLSSLGNIAETKTDTVEPFTKNATDAKAAEPTDVVVVPDKCNNRSSDQAAHGHDDAQELAPPGIPLASAVYGLDDNPSSDEVPSKNKAARDSFSNDFSTIVDRTLCSLDHSAIEKKTTEELACFEGLCVDSAKRQQSFEENNSISAVETVIKIDD